MKSPPGSVGWLLLHELKLFWFNAGSFSETAGKRRPGAAVIGILALGWTLLHAGAWYVVRRLDGFDRMAPPLLASVTVVLLVSATTMLSSSMKASVVALFERGDLDLLLSSPLSSLSIFSVRLAAVSAGTAAVYYFLLAPFAHAGLLLGRFAWLGIYPTVIGLAVLSSCCAMLMTLGLVRALGAHRTRTVAQVLGALAGASVFILSQLYMHLGQDKQQDFGSALQTMFAEHGAQDASSLLWLPARAALGEWLPALSVLAVAALAFVLTAATTHRFFVGGLQQVAPRIQPATRPAAERRYGFRRSLFHTVVVKEWRLIRRDPHLISQVLLQLLYLVPLCFLVFNKSALQLPAITAGLTLLCGSLAGSLAWIAISAEDAPDLLRSAPARKHTIMLAKLAAAVIPAFAVVALPLLWLGARSPVAGLLACVPTIAAVCTAALVVLWCGRPGQRSNFKGGGKGNYLSNILEMLGNLCWGAFGGLIMAINTVWPPEGVLLAAMAALAGGVAVLLTAWMLRNQGADAR